MSTSTPLAPVEALPGVNPCRDDWSARAAVIAEVAARHAQEVDREGRFPAEAVQAMRDSGLLAAWVPQSLGGPGLSLRQIAAMCAQIGGACGASGMIFAMHQSSCPRSCTTLAPLLGTRPCKSEWSPRPCCWVR